MYLYENEAKRLFTLQELELLEGPRDPAFDRITLLATMLLGVPAAGISVVDGDSAWGNGGTGIAWRGSVPREGSIAGRVVDTADVVRIDDTSGDAVLQNHPLVRQFGVRSALAVPLILSSGVVLGALIALDTTLRRFSSEDLHQLELLRDVVVGLLEERLRLPTARRTELTALHAAFDETEMGIAIAILASDGSAPRLIYVNDAMLQLSGCTRADILTGRAKFFDDPSNAELAKRIAGAMLRDTHEIFSACVLRRDETKHWNIRVTPIGTFDGQMRFILLINDVTHEAVLANEIESRRRERAESDQIIGALFSEMSDFLVIADATPPSNGGPIASYVNASLAGFVGADPAAISGKPVLELLDPSVNDQTRASLLARFEHYLPIATEVPLRRADGTPGWVAGTGSVIRDEAGNPTHWLLVGRDITLRKAQYRETTQFVTALDSADEPIVIYELDHDGAFEVSYSNRAATESRAYAFDELLSQSDRTGESALRAHLDGGHSFQTLIHRDCGPKAGWLSLEVRPTLGADGELRSLIAIEHRLDWQRTPELDALTVAISLGREIRSFRSIPERQAAVERVLAIEWNARMECVNSANGSGVDIDRHAGRASANMPPGFLDDEHVSIRIQWSEQLTATRTTALRVFLEQLSGS